MEWLDLIIEILKAVVIIIPLVVALVNAVRKAIKEKNWSLLVSMVTGYIEVAEEKFTNGAERKEWVMAMVEEAAHSINYEFDSAVVSDLIDNLCSMAKKVNVTK